MVDIGSRIKKRRKHLKLDRREFARTIGISYTTLSDWEAGRMQRSAKAPIHVVARELRTNVRWLESGAGDWDKTDQDVVAATQDRQMIWGFNLSFAGAEAGAEWQKLLENDEAAAKAVLLMLHRLTGKAVLAARRRKRDKAKPATAVTSPAT